MRWGGFVITVAGRTADTGKVVNRDPLQPKGRSIFTEGHCGRKLGTTCS